MHYERLKHLAGQGDTAAAAELQREATHRGDIPTLAFALAAQSDTESLIQQGALAWESSRWDHLHAWTEAIGAPLSQAQAEQLDALIAATNKAIHRPQHHLKRADVLSVLTRALASEAHYSDTHTGFGSGSLRCAVVLAACEGDLLTLGIAPAPRQSASPGTAWPSELRPWRPEAPSTRARLRAWAGQTAPDRLRLSISRRSAEHPLKALNPHDDTRTRAWTHKLKRAMRGSLSPEKWTEICALLQDPADEAIAAERLAAIRNNSRNSIPWARADWIEAALKTGDFAKDHWHLTKALSVTSKDPPLTQTCAAMKGLTDLHIDLMGCEDAREQSRSLQAIAASPHLTSLVSLFTVHGSFDRESLQPLFASETLPALSRLVLAEVNLPAASWPLLQRALFSLSLEAKAPNALDMAMQWLHDSPQRPEEVFFRYWLQTPFTLPEVDLAGVKTLGIAPPPRTLPAEHGEALAVILGRLKAPDLGRLFITTPRVTPSLIDALVALGQTLNPASDPAARPRLMLREDSYTLSEWALSRPDSERSWNHPLANRLLGEVAPLWFLVH